MRIGVMTFWWSEDNYGQLLQCYALQKYLRDLGHDAYVIRFRLPDTQWNWKQKLIKYGLHPWRVLDGIRQMRARAKGCVENKLAGRDFDGFRKRHIRFSDKVYGSLDELRANPPEADLYIVGSDQVWNNCGGTLTEDSVRAYFLDFGSLGTKRVSYAASWGRTSVDHGEVRRLSPLLKRFQAISVRERSGVKICECCGVTASWVCDPTLLLNRENYLEIAEMPSTQQRDYVFAYVLANDCEFSYKKLSEWTRRQNLDLVYVKGNSGQIVHFDDADAVVSRLTIPQWLGFLAKAKFVVTNSFHCCLFSIVFGCKFGVIPLKGGFAGSNNRIADLCVLTGNHLHEIRGNRFDELIALEAPDLKTDAATSGRAFLNKVRSS